jgi:hypothetical protein
VYGRREAFSIHKVGISYGAFVPKKTSYDRFFKLTSYGTDSQEETTACYNESHDNIYYIKNRSVYALSVSGTNKAISDACLKFPSLGFIPYPGDIKTQITSEWGWGGGRMVNTIQRVLNDL